jgi:hypothetical protein
MDQYTTNPMNHEPDVLPFGMVPYVFEIEDWWNYAITQLQVIRSGLFE